MILCNTTICIDINVEPQWTSWMKTVYLPLLRETSCIAQARLFRIQSNEEEGGASYALQLEYKTTEAYTEFTERYKSGFDALHLGKFSNHFAAFSTILNEV